MYKVAADGENDLPSLSTYMWYIRSFYVQNIIQLVDASQTACHLKDTDKFCVFRMLASWERIFSVLLSLAESTELILYWSVAYRGGWFGVFKPPPPKFRSYR